MTKKINLKRKEGIFVPPVHPTIGMEQDMIQLGKKKYNQSENCIEWFILFFSFIIDFVCCLCVIFFFESKEILLFFQ